jgi:hypothetical protein
MLSQLLLSETQPIINVPPSVKTISNFSLFTLKLRFFPEASREAVKLPVYPKKPPPVNFGVGSNARRKPEFLVRALKPVLFRAAARQPHSPCSQLPPRNTY